MSKQEYSQSEWEPAITVYAVEFQNGSVAKLFLHEESAGAYARWLKTQGINSIIAHRIIWQRKLVESSDSE